MYARDVPPGQIFYHGTKADLAVGDLLEPGFGSNFLDGTPLSWIYFSATLDAAIWGAELARSDGRERIYIVEPTGPFEDDPNLTDKKFPGNVTASYRSRQPLRIVGELDEWEGHSPERLAEMRAFLASETAKEILD
jgi:rifampin ADP-ribosylating transferase